MEQVLIRVFCTFQFEGFHRWKDAPDTVGYLRDLHRHIFHVRCEKEVKHEDRDVEFIMLKTYIKQWVYGIQTKNPHDGGHDDCTLWSCERWAHEILKAFSLVKVEVSEDGENGAVVDRLVFLD